MLAEDTGPDSDFDEDEGPDTPEEAGLADDAASGLACNECGTYFSEAHGYPVLCDSCWKNTSPDERKEMGVQPAIHPEV